MAFRSFAPRAHCGLAALVALVLLPLLTPPAAAQAFEEAVHNVGNTGVTVTNSGFLGRAGVRNNTAGPPSFAYPLGSGVEHLFEAGLWVGAIRADGLVTVRTAAAESGAGYTPGNASYEVAPASPITSRSSLPESPFFTPLAVSHQDFISTFADTARVVPGTFTPMPDPQGQLGMAVETRSYAWSFPFTEYFVIVEYEVRNISGQPWDSVYVGIWEDLVVRNVLTTTDAGSNFFNKGARGFLGMPEYDANGRLVNAVTDSMIVSYAYNAGGTEESLNTYGAIAFLGAEWQDPQRGRRFFHPYLQDEYRADGLPAPRVNKRWWKFAGGNAELARPANDEERYRRMATSLPLDGPVPGDADPRPLRQRLAEDGRAANGNWLGLMSVGPFRRVEPGESVTVVFALVAAQKPPEFQGLAARPLDNEDTRRLLRNNVFWAMRTYAGEDLNYNGRLDPGEDLNGNGVLDRYLIPEPPQSPRLRVELERGRAILYWDDRAETSVDPVSGRQDFEGYRIYRSDPGDDRSGDLIGRAGLIAQFDRPGNDIGFNTGFDAIRLPEPVFFPGDPTPYRYRFVEDGLLSGWQYVFAVTAFDEGDPEAGLPSFESSRTASAVRVFPGAAAVDGTAPDRPPVGVYPNPYRVSAAWDGPANTQRKLYFTNLPARAQIRVYTLAGDVIAEMDHDAATYTGDTRWYEVYSAPGRVVAGGEHAWDLLNDSNLVPASGLYLFTVLDRDTGEVQTGKFVVIR